MLGTGRAHADWSLSVARGPDGSPGLDGVPLPPAPEFAAAAILASVDRAVLSSTRCLAIHAAAVAGARGAAVIPGASGAGKSTLAAACMQLGLRLMSDEAACVDASSGLLVPHARPLGLSGHSRGLLGLHLGGGSPDEELATAPALLGGCVPADETVPVALVVLTDRRSDAAPGLLRGSQADGLAALLGGCLNAGAGARWSPESAWLVLGRLIRSVHVARLTYDAPQDGARLLAEALSPGQGPRPSAEPATWSKKAWRPPGPPDG